MANLSDKELTAINEQLQAEQLLIKKFKLYSQVATDPQIRTKCEQIAARHQGHFDKLFGQLG